MTYRSREAVFYRINDWNPGDAGYASILTTVNGIARHWSIHALALGEIEYVAAVVTAADHRLLSRNDADQVFYAAKSCAEWWWRNVITR